MIKIGKSYIVNEKESARLCADISINDYSFTIWFSVNNEQKEYLSGGISDPFVMAVLPLVLGEEGGGKTEDFL